MNDDPEFYHIENVLYNGGHLEEDTMGGLTLWDRNGQREYVSPELLSEYLESITYDLLEDSEDYE